MKYSLRPATEADVLKLLPLLKRALRNADRPAVAYTEIHLLFRLIGTRLTPPLRTQMHDYLCRLFADGEETNADQCSAQLQSGQEYRNSDMADAPAMDVPDQGVRA